MFSIFKKVLHEFNYSSVNILKNLASAGPRLGCMRLKNKVGQGRDLSVDWKFCMYEENVYFQIGKLNKPSQPNAEFELKN
jgi:hypothetical protein